MEICQNTFMIVYSFSIMVVVDVFQGENNCYTHIQIHHKIALNNLILSC